MESSPTSPEVAARPLLRDRALGLMAAATLLAILYFARDVLVPITLAFLLSLLVAPLVRALRRLNIGQTFSVLLAVLVVAFSFGSITAVIGSQLVHMAASLPQYERNIGRKLETLNSVTVGRFNALTGQAGRLLSQRDQPPQTLEEAQKAGAVAPIPVELHDAPANALQVVERVVGSVWVPLETAGIVLVVLIFALLEQEALRDRFIRIAGGADIRLTTLAINDAGERLSRFFVSQFAVNFGVGGLVWAGLTLMGLPHPLLWGALSAVLRFVPYVGIWIAALCAALVAAAVDPHWGLTFAILGLFLVVELIAGQLVEPQLYGHTTGLSPLSVVIAAIFWSWLWGPVGLILSTPLTLCLLVAGRHIKALSLLDILLGDTQALTMPQRFYQRALSGDADEIISGARSFLKRDTFASYCDLVLLPALQLARLDLQSGSITTDQQARVRGAMLAVIAAIGGENRRLSRRRMRSTVLGISVGRELRQQREQVSGRWQGPLIVPPGSVMLCMGLGSMADDLATELLVRILRDQKIDARHMSLDDLNAEPPPAGASNAVLIIYVVSAFPSEERGRGAPTVAELRRRFPEACIVAVFLRGLLLQPEPAGAPADRVPGVDKSAVSLGHALQICLDMHQETAAVAG